MKRLMKVGSVLLAAAGILVGCGGSDSSRISVNYDENRCGYYVERYSQTADEMWHELYVRDCLAAVIDLNTPAGLPAACRDLYADMVREADQIAFSVSEACAFGELSADCVAAQAAIDALATEFTAACESQQFFLPEADLYARQLPPLLNAGGACTWTTWIPPETRLPEQSAEVEVLCSEVPPACSKQIVNGVAQWVETYQAVDGAPVYLPCAEQFVYGFNPCDEDLDGLVSPFESRVCSESDQVEPCDFDLDGTVDEFEAQSCQFFSVSNQTYVDTRYVDPCDYDYNGVVDQWESEQCYSVYGCAEDEEMYWDSLTFQDVCVKQVDVPFCPHPSWPEYLNGRVVCMHPCDMNRDGEVDAWEQYNCNFIDCAPGQVPFWDPQQAKDVCVAETAIPSCDFPQWPESVNGEIVCVHPCDMNRDGVVDDWEESHCTFTSCGEGEISFWDPVQGRDVCFADPLCSYPSWPELFGDEVICRHPCDQNADGMVDETEQARCFY